MDIRLRTPGRPKLLVVLMLLTFGIGCQLNPSTPPAPTAGATSTLMSATKDTDATIPSAPAPTATAILTPSAPATTVAPVQIVIETPAPGTQVGSPLVVTGRTSAIPAGGRLRYLIRDGTGAEIGTGDIVVQPGPAGGGVFDASLTFSNSSGGIILVEILQFTVGEAVLARATIDLWVDSGQRITIETPARGTQVGSPLVITGNTTRYPFDGRLDYQVIDQGGAQLGSGTFSVVGAPGSPTRFSGEIYFALPPSGGGIRVDLLDRHAGTNLIAAAASVDLFVAPPPPPTPIFDQSLVIDSPPTGTLVGSPVVIIGRAARPPSDGKLSYRFFDSTGALLGEGSFPLSNPSGQPTLFNVSLSFRLPPAGGPITFELSDRASTGQLIAQTSLGLQVASQSQVTISPNPTVSSGPTVTFTPTPTMTRSPTPTPTESSSPTPSPTPCSTLSCGAADDFEPTLVIAPGGPNDPTFVPCARAGADPSISDETEVGASRDLQLGQRAYYFACNFTDPSTLTAEMSGPGGVQVLDVFSDVPNPDLQMGAAQRVVPWSAVCNLQTGAYTLTLRDSTGDAAALSFMLNETDRERIVSVPQTGPAGASFTVHYCGYGTHINQVVEIDFYFEVSQDAEGRREFRRSTSTWTVTIDANGSASSTIRTQGGDPVRAYLIRDREAVLKGFDLIWLIP